MESLLETLEVTAEWAQRCRQSAGKLFQRCNQAVGWDGLGKKGKQIKHDKYNLFSKGLKGCFWVLEIFGWGCNPVLDGYVLSFWPGCGMFLAHFLCWLLRSTNWPSKRNDPLRGGGAEQSFACAAKKEGLCQMFLGEPAVGREDPPGFSTMRRLQNYHKAESKNHRGRIQKHFSPTKRTKRTKLRSFAVLQQSRRDLGKFELYWCRPMNAAFGAPSRRNRKRICCRTFSLPLLVAAFLFMKV